MTDNEIIKALECCSCKPLKCNDCPCMQTGERFEVEKYAIDLINRQKAEIEDLETEIDNPYEQAKADILGNMADGGVSCHWCIEKHRANAIKEFAERLCDDRISNDPVVIAVKAELKEMVGDNNAE